MPPPACPTTSRRSNSTAGSTGPSGRSGPIRAAETPIAQLDVSFVRIDGHLTGEGGVFGEFSSGPTAGRRGFTDPKCDAMLGRLWPQTLDQLGLDCRLSMTMHADRFLRTLYTAWNKVGRRLRRRRGLTT